MKPWMLPGMAFVFGIVALGGAIGLRAFGQDVPNELWGLALGSFAFLTGAGASAKTAV